MSVPSLKIDTAEPFWLSALKQTCVLSGIIPLYVHIYNNLETLERNINLEYSFGSVTYVYQVDEKNNIQLINE